MSAFSNGSTVSRKSSLSYGSLGSVGRWKLDEQKRRLREAKRRASAYVQEVKVLKEECSQLNVKIKEDDTSLQSLQAQKEELQTSVASDQQLAEVEVKIRESRKQMKGNKLQLDKATRLLEERLEDQRLIYDQLLADERAIQIAENEETSSTDAALQRELKHLSEEMLRLQGLCQEMHGACATVGHQEDVPALVLQPRDENVMSSASSSKRDPRTVAGKDAALQKERDQLERELAAAKAVADSIRREAEEKAEAKKQQLAVLTEELERMKTANAELSREVPLLTEENQQLKDEQEAQRQRTEELQMTIDYMQEWQALLKEKVASSTGKSLGGSSLRGSTEREGASIERNQGGLAKRLDFDDALPGGPMSAEFEPPGQTPDTAMRGREECARIFVQGLERAMVGTPLSISVLEEGDLQQLVSEVERDMGGERIRELEALVASLSSEVVLLREGAAEPVAVAAGEVPLEATAADELGRESELEEKLANEKGRREAAERRSEELAIQLSLLQTDGSTASVDGVSAVSEEGRLAVQDYEGSDGTPRLESGAERLKQIADLSEKLSQSEAAQVEAEETVFELVKDLAALRGQYEAFRREKRDAANQQREHGRLIRRLTRQGLVVAVQLILFVYFAASVAGALGLCGFSSPT